VYTVCPDLLYTLQLKFQNLSLIAILFLLVLVIKNLIVNKLLLLERNVLIYYRIASN